MSRSTGHPDYVYRPASSEHREKLAASHRARLGIPDGCRVLYGVLVPLWIYPEVSKAAHAYRHDKRGNQSIENTAAFVRLLVRMLTGIALQWEPPSG